ncbi:PAS domain-containing protein [Ferruginivarius sediminum]|uniref:histidine kinase n=2 Tax=Ferruginivarius sediminum TaxID=2661937 RepID=A0A369T4Z4_9PROT|nr:PAS domain-containing protein [Ferruginivarius sediminum]
MAGMQWYRHRWQVAARGLDRVQRAYRQLEQRIETAPSAWFAFDAKPCCSRSLADLLGGDAAIDDFDAVCRCFSENSGRRLSEAGQRLRESGEAFTLVLSLPEDGRWVQAHGVSGPEGPVIWFSDISERETARRSAEARNAVLEDLVERLPAPLWRRDASLRVVDCNAAYARAVGRTRQEVRADEAELLGSGLGEAGRRLAERARDSGQTCRETHHLVAEGARRFMDLTEIPLRDGTLVGLALDRTREEEVEGELSRHIAAHADVLENLGTAIVIYGPDLRVKFYNGAYVELWGLEETLLDGEPHLNDVIEALRERRRLPEQTDFPAYKRECQLRMRNLLDAEEELMHRPDGSTLKITMAPHPFGGVLMTYEDVTDRLTLERNFNTLIEVQRETIDNLYEAVAVFGADGRLALSNQAFSEMWQLPLDRLGDRPHVRQVLEYGRRFFDIDESDWPALQETIVARATEPGARSGRMVRSDGKELDWAQVPLPDGQSLFIYLDVTDSLRVERALRERAEALETADRLKSEFIANISYELRTPLNAIVGFAEILENEFFGKLNTRQGEYARAIVDSSQRLIGLINDILDLATIEAGYLELEQGETDVRTLLTDLQTIAHERARNRGIELAVDCDDGDCTLICDSRRLKQALFNLLSNAFNFTPEGGKVVLSARQDGDNVRLSVNDTGMGIPHEEQEHVFHKFVRGHPRKSGAGLGLSLVKSLVELHGGRVELESAPDHGTRVTCILPRIPRETHLPGDPPAATAER